MAYESFFEDMIIDTPEAIASVEELIDSGITWKSNGTNPEFVSADSDFIREVMRNLRNKADSKNDKPC